MSDEGTNTTRRTALKLAGASLGGSLLSGAAVGEDGVVVDTALTNAAGRRDVIILLDGTPLEVAAPDDVTPDSVGTEIPRTDLRSGVEKSQEPTKTTLQEMDGVELHRSLWVINGLLTTVDTDVVDVDTDIAGIDAVAGVYENKEVPPPSPVDQAPAATTELTDAEPTYGLAQINAPAAHEEFGTTGSGANLAVVDTGIDPDHPSHSDFDPQNFTEFTLMAEEVETDPNDSDDHGTHVSGTALGDPATIGDTTVGIGVAPDATLYSAKSFSTFDGSTSATTAQVVAGVQWAVEEGADVVNMSLGSVVEEESIFDSFYLRVIRGVVDSGVVPVASSGNNGQGLTGSPGNIRESFSIAASNPQEEIATFSSGERVYTDNAWEQDAPDNYPTWYTIPDVTAPGVGVLSSVRGGEYAEFNGTSMAAPHVTGAIGLMLGAYPDLSPLDAQQYLAETAVHPAGQGATGTEFGQGIIDVLAALTAAGDGGVVSGTVTNGSGEPVVGLELETDYGTRAITDAEGRYELYLGPGDHEIVANQFGRVRQTQQLTVEANSETSGIDLSVPPELAIQPVAGQPPETVRGESFTIQVAVANLDSLTVELGPETENIDAEDISLAIEPLDAEFGIGETVSVGGVSTTVPLTVSIAAGGVVANYTNSENVVEDSTLLEAINDWRSGALSDSEFVEVLSAWQTGEPVTGSGGPGVLQLVHTFAGVGQSQEVQTGPTDVVVGDPATFEITDATLPDEAGNEITVSATIENTGDVVGTQSVIYDIGGFQFSQQLTVDAGDTGEFSTTVTGIQSVFAGQEVTHQILTQADSVQDTVLVTAPATTEGGFTIRDLTAPTTVQSGETIEVEAVIENTSPDRLSSLVSYDFDARASQSDSVENVAFRAVEIGGERVKTVTFELETDGLLPGTYQHGVLTNQESQFVEITVTEA